MTKTLKLLSLLFIFICSMTFALSAEDDAVNQYRMYVTKVDPEFHCFALSNGMVCNTVKQEWMKEKLPEVGDEIFLIPLIRSSLSFEEKTERGEFLAFSEKTGLSVWVSPESRQNCPSYVSIKLENSPSPEGLLPVKLKVIKLSDGSKWLSEKVPPFDLGVTVVVTASRESGKWFLTDLSRDCFLGTDRALRVFYNQVEVQPYRSVE